MQINPIEQFTIKEWIPLDLFGIDASFTNAALFMVLAAFGIIVLFWLPMRGRYEIPNRMQALVEITYEFVRDLVRGTAGPEAMRFFPLIFSLFIYILFANMLGLIPGAFTFTSHIIVTGALSFFVMLLITVYGFYRNGFGFLKLFAPSGVGIGMLLLLVPLEIISYLVRPFSLALRLGVNMLAGHMIVKVFASFVVLLVTSGSITGMALGLTSFMILLGITALELLVAFLQAYVFAILISVYLHDAFHPSH